MNWSLQKLTTVNSIKEICFLFAGINLSRHKHVRKSASSKTLHDSIPVCMKTGNSKNVAVEAEV